MKKPKATPIKLFKTARDPEMNSATSEKLRKASRKNSDEVFQMLDSSVGGISSEDAEKRISKYGLNEVDYDRAPSWYVQLIKAFANPFVLILLAIVVIYLI